MSSAVVKERWKLVRIQCFLEPLETLLVGGEVPQTQVLLLLGNGHYH